MEIKYYRICRLRCRHCGSVMEWRNRSKDDRGPGYPMMCQCKKVGFDPSACFYRILGNETDWEDLSEPWEEK